jgi:hypothetical protein
MPIQPPTEAEYFRHAFRTAEQDLERLREAVSQAIRDAEAERTHPDLDSSILNALINDLMRIVDQTADRHQRAQDAYNAVDHSPQGDPS